jgi:hypothetical protein
LTAYYGYYSAFLILLFLWLALRRERKAAVAAHHVKRTKKETELMEELARRFIGKECIIYTVTSSSGDLQGTVKEVGSGGILIEDKSGSQQAVNLEYVTRIREYPRGKNGKKKSVVLD